MQCSDAHPLLALHAYGDLAESERANLETHLALCPACRQELSGFQKLRQQLDALPVPSGAIEVGQLYRRQALRRQRQARRWQLVAFGAIVATVLALLARLEVHAGGQQIVIRWGKPDSAAAIEKKEAAPEPASNQTMASRELLERLQVMNDLIYAMAESMDTGDRERRVELQRLQLEIVALQRQTQQHYDETQHDVDALYAAQFGDRMHETKP